MALFVAALATMIVTGLFWNQFVLLRTIENQQLVTQSRLLLRGALDWSRAILREDQRTTAQDTLAEPWAQGLAETRLDQLGESSALASLASMAGGIEDAQSRLNLRNLVRLDGEIDVYERDSLRRLCSVLSLPEAVADIVAEHMRLALLPAATTPGEAGTGSGTPAAPAAADDAPRPLPLVQPEDLLGVPGIDPAHAAKLAPYVVVLDAPAPVNLNTTSAEVMSARFPKMSLSDAKALVAQRQSTWFTQVGDVRLARFYVDGEPTTARVDVKSNYFLVSGTVRLDRASTRMQALIRRGGTAREPARILWQREL